MSISLTNVEQALFDAEVKKEYRSEGFKLKGTLRLRQDVVGKTVEFRRKGQVIANPTGYMQSVTIQDGNYQKEIAILEKHTAATGVDDVQDLTVNFDTRMENVELVADAMGRRSDQIIIDALVANAGNTIPAGAANMNFTKFTQVIEDFEDKGVPLKDRFMAMSASNFRALMAEPQFTSQDYSSNMVFDSGMVRDYLGVNIIIIPQMDEGGLPKTVGNVRSALAWHRRAAGMGIGANFRTEVGYLRRETTWLINGIFSAGAVVIDNRGVQIIECQE